LAAAVEAAQLMTELDYAYISFVSEFNKFYESTEEFNMRKELFKATQATVDRLNNHPDNDGSYEAGLNFSADWTEEEKESLFGYRPSMELISADQEVYSFEGESNGATNWCNKGKCTAVRQQGGCGSCWAFSATEVLESAHAIKSGQSPKYLSPQQLVDCVPNCNCSGGSYHSAYNWLKSHKAALDSNYPYTGKNGTCKNVSGTYGVSSFGSVSGNTSSIKSAVEKGPINVAVCGKCDPFYNYKGGIITTSMGCGDHLDHAIAAVGWGSSNGKDYYIVRNSWGTRWGESGFARIQTASSGTGVCGIHKDVVHVTSS